MYCLKILYYKQKKEIKSSAVLSTYLLKNKNAHFVLIPHLVEEQLIIDIEKTENSSHLHSITYQEQLNTILSQIEQTKTLEKAFQTATHLIKNIFNYNRVMLYRFDKDWNGVSNLF